MRLVLVGSGSFIASHVKQCAQQAKIDILALPHDAKFAGLLRKEDRLINFARHPDFQNAPYDKAKDYDLKAAEIAAEKDAHFTMLSTRRVYSKAVKWGATEQSVSSGDETLYGRNKAASETAIQSLCPGSAVLRLSNIIGFEYAPVRPRKTFMGMMLDTLRTQGTITFDMSPDTAKDFLPVETCAEAILRTALSGKAGTFNLGSGLGTPCGALATALMAGFGKGQLIAKSHEIYDAFFLNIDKWQSEFGHLQTQVSLIEYCMLLGRRLRDA